MLSRWSALLLLILLANSGCGTGPVYGQELRQHDMTYRLEEQRRAIERQRQELEALRAPDYSPFTSGSGGVARGSGQGVGDGGPWGGSTPNSSLDPSVLKRIGAPGRALSITDGTNSVVVDCRSDRTLSLLLTYQGTRLSFSGRRIIFQFDNGPEYTSTGVKLRAEKTKKFVEDMVSHRTLALWVPGDVANRAKFDLRPVRHDLQSLVKRCKVPVHDPEGVPPRVTIASRRANIRTRPDVKSDVLGQATEGLSFPVVSEEGEWLKINYADRTGWVHRGVTERGEERKVKHALPTLPAPPARSRKSNETAESVYINVAVANIRSGPGKHYETVGQGTRGESLVVIGSHERWLNVEFRQRQAWVHKSIIANTLRQAQATEEKLPNLKVTLRRELDANLNNKDSGGYRIKGWFYNRTTRKFIVYVHGGDGWLRGYAGNPGLFVPAIAVVAAVEFIFDDYPTTPRPQRYSFNQGTRELFKIDPNELLETIRGLGMQ